MNYEILTNYSSIDNRAAIKIDGNIIYAGALVYSNTPNKTQYILLHDSANNKFVIRSLKSGERYDIPKCGITLDDRYYQHGDMISNNVVLGYNSSEKKLMVRDYKGEKQKCDIKIKGAVVFPTGKLFDLKEGIGLEGFRSEEHYKNIMSYIQDNYNYKWNDGTSAYAGRVSYREDIKIHFHKDYLTWSEYRRDSSYDYIDVSNILLDDSDYDHMSDEEYNELYPESSIGIQGDSIIMDEAQTLNTNKTNMNKFNELQMNEFFSSKKNVKAIKEMSETLKGFFNKFNKARDSLQNMEYKVEALADEFHKALDNNNYVQIKKLLEVNKGLIEYMERYSENKIEDLVEEVKETREPEDYFNS